MIIVALFFESLVVGSLKIFKQGDGFHGSSLVSGLEGALREKVWWPPLKICEASELPASSVNAQLWKFSSGPWSLGVNGLIDVIGEGLSCW